MAYKSGGGGEWWVTVVRGWRSRNDREARAYALASNKLSELGGWDEDLLADFSAPLDSEDLLAGTGFDLDDLEAIRSEQVDSSADDAPPLPKSTSVRRGDVYALGDHLIVCGDSTDQRVISELLGEKKCAMSFTDPPWNVAYGAPVNKRRRHRAPIANDNLGEEFPAFCKAFCDRIAEVLIPGGALYLVMSCQEWPTIDGHLRATGFHWSSSIIWAKDALILGRKDYHAQYEPIWYGWRDGAPRAHPVRDRKQSDVWQIPRPRASEEHPTMKPVELVARALRNSTSRGAIVFEPFSGSGTTIVACEETGRRCAAVELEPAYVQVAIDRWEKLTGKSAERITGRPGRAGAGRRRRSDARP